jgi:hypothetical protein
MRIFRVAEGEVVIRSSSEVRLRQSTLTADGCTGKRFAIDENCRGTVSGRYVGVNGLATVCDD